MLETLRLTLKVASHQEAQLMVQLNKDYEVIRYTGDGHLRDTSHAQQIINDYFLPQFEKYKMGRFSVYLKDGTFLGWCGLRYFPETEEVDLGYRFMKEYW